MLSNYLPKTADIDGRWLIFYDTSRALARCELHEDQDFKKDVPGTVGLCPGYWENDDHYFIRLKPETLRIISRGFPDRGVDQVYFDTDEERQDIVEDFPALVAEAQRRAYLAAHRRWEKEVDRLGDVAQDELPPEPVFEPARAEWEAWQAALTEWRATFAPDADKKLTITYNRYKERVPVTETETLCVDNVRKQRLQQGPQPDGAMIGQTHQAIAAIAAWRIDRFNGNFECTERWHDAPQLPAPCELNYPAIAFQLNQAVARIITKAQKPRQFRVDSFADVLGILKLVHEETYKN